uniref:Uracil phosphoribosyltransferase n=1 Tax=Palisada sp. TaxID=1955416 RepID=A0A1Z1MSK7_9FLOR|nr:uracil phosphoribosyltransferase [Palisada sp.]
MQLNIYNISHPIIQILSNITTIKSTNNILYSCYYKNLGLLLIYEVLRKYIKIKTVYIKLLNSTKQLKLINESEKYLVVTDLSKTYEIISNIKTLVPNIDIININYKDTPNLQNINSNTEIENENAHIFILEEKLNNVNTINLIKYLTLIQKIHIDYISIICITSEQSILQQLGDFYPKMKVYTTQILYTR